MKVLTGFEMRDTFCLRSKGRERKERREQQMTNVSKRVKSNGRLQRIKDYLQNGNLTFLEAVRAVMEMFQNGLLAVDEAELAIRQINRIKLPH